MILIGVLVVPILVLNNNDTQSSEAADVGMASQSHPRENTPSDIVPVDLLGNKLSHVYSA